MKTETAYSYYTYYFIKKLLRKVAICHFLLEMVLILYLHFPSLGFRPLFWSLILTKDYKFRIKTQMLFIFLHPFSSLQQKGGERLQEKARGSTTTTASTATYTAKLSQTYAQHKPALKQGVGTKPYLILLFVFMGLWLACFTACKEAYSQPKKYQRKTKHDNPGN